MSANVSDSPTVELMPTTNGETRAQRGINREVSAIAMIKDEDVQYSTVLLPKSAYV